MSTPSLLPSLRSLLPAFPLLLVAACGGSGDGGSAPRARTATLALLVDTAAGSDAILSARIDAVVLERGDGTMTGNLLLEPGAVTLAHPLAAPSGLALDAVPDGTFLVLHLLFAQSGPSARLADGSVRPVTMPRRDLRVLFEEPFVTGPGRAQWLLLRHRAPVALTAGAGGVLVWSPKLAARGGQIQPVANATVTLSSVNAQGSTAQGTLGQAGGMAVTLEFGPSSVLTNAATNQKVTTAQFLASLAPGGDIRANGLLGSNGTMGVESAESSSSSSSSEFEVLGRIQSLDATRKSFVLAVQVLLRGSVTLPGNTLTVLAGSARVYRSGSRHVALAFGDLATGQLVEVEWKPGMLSGTTLTAHEVEIEGGTSSGGGGGSSSPEIEGEIGSIDLAKSRILAVPRGNDPLLVAGKSQSSAEILVSSSTVLVDKDSGKRLALAELGVGRRLWVLGTVLAPTRVQARLVRVR